jgi:S1-C subfamily serine protease
LDPAEVLEQQERDYLTGLLELRSGVQENRAAASASADSIRARIEGLDASTASYEAMASLARDKASSLVLLQVGFLLDGDYISGPTGTGFAVGDGMIVTNAHVAEPHLFALSSEESVLGCTVAALAAAGDAVQTVLSIWHAGAALHYGSTGALDPASASWSSRDEAVEVVARGTATSSDEAFPCDEEGSEVRSGLTVERALSGPDSDLAIIRVRGANLPALELASAAPQEGDPVIALGFPRGLLPQDNGEATADISFGFVGRVTGVLMIDDELLPGGEGGPVLDAEGRVVGVSTVPFGSRIQAIHAEHVRALLRQVG